MPNIVTADELRAVLGVSDSLYDDAYLEQIIDSAELTILPMLTAYTSAVTTYEIKSNKIYFSTQRLNQFVEGQSVVVANCGATANGTYTVDNQVLDPFGNMTASFFAQIRPRPIPLHLSR
jgi:hypothetical protein